MAKPLHVATSLKIVAKQMHVAKPSIMVVRDRIQRLAGARVTREDQLLAEELEEATGMPIAELAKLTERWLSEGLSSRSVSSHPVHQDSRSRIAILSLAHISSCTPAASGATEPYGFASLLRPTALASRPSKKACSLSLSVPVFVIRTLR